MSPGQEADLEDRLAAMAAELDTMRQEVADLRAAMEHKIPPAWLRAELGALRFPWLKVDPVGS